MSENKNINEITERINQDLTIENIQKKITHALETGSYNNSESIKSLLLEVHEDLSAFLKDDIDFKAVVNTMDDSILITDKDGRVIYLNPNYEVNTGIPADRLIGRTIMEIESSGDLFVGGAVTDVLETKKKAFRLSKVLVTDPPQTGYVIGVPLFDDYGQLKQVVASSRPILSLRALQDDFDRFLAEANAIKMTQDNVKVVNDADAPALQSTRLIGRSPAIKKTLDMIQNAAPTDATVLITGESGVGKEIIADEIYRMSNRNKKPFIKVNCASIPLNLLESELFGYEKGAFSGASANGKQGLFEMANHGTLLLDEIGDMPMDLQVKLLRAIQNKEITKVGGTKPIPLDIRFIAATNSDLKKKIAAGTFRQDLYYRLNVIPIQMPPLRERKEDIQLICNYFVDLYGEKHKRHLQLNERHMEILMAYNWPGNIRELENVIEYLTICSQGNANFDQNLLLGILDLNQDDEVSNIVAGCDAGVVSDSCAGAITDAGVSTDASDGPVDGDGAGSGVSDFLASGQTLIESVENYEKNIIEEVLKTSHSLREAGAKLGVNASTISRKIKQYGIEYSNR